MTEFTNSYVVTDTILEAYIGANPKTEAVALKALVAASQEWYCQEATRKIDALPLQGYKILSTQTLQFPRKYEPSEFASPWGSLMIEDAYGYIYESLDVPTDVINACCEEAIAIYGAGASGGRQALQAQGVQSYSIGGKLQETFAPGAKDMNGGLKSSAAYSYLMKYLAGGCPII